MSIYGVILAGGGGRRLGGANKSKIRLGSKSLATYVYNQLLGQTDAICVTNAIAQITSAWPKTVACIIDPFSPQIGPLGGISAGYEWAVALGAAEQNDYLLVTPVDTPLFPENFVKYMLNGKDGADVFVARYGDQEYPTCSLWRCGAAARIAATRASARNNSIKGYLEELDVDYVDFSAICSNNPFKNVNKISDLIELSARAA